MSKRSHEIRRAVLREVFWQSTSPVRQVSVAYGVTPQAVQLHVQHLAADGLLLASGEKRYRRYELAITAKKHRAFVLRGLAEDRVWTTFAAPAVADLADEEKLICSYGLTEMVNNAIDHSGGKKVTVRISRTDVSIMVEVVDDGEGIFHKIAGALGLSDSRLALLELSKGKFTTDPARHTGEGIFFSSRLFDRYQVRSGKLAFSRSTRTDEWRAETRDRAGRGTTVSMALLLPSSTVMRDVFSRFSSGPEEYRFAKTHVPLKLALFEDEAMMSRSSAKRVLSRVERFDEVQLDFAGVRSIGQAFADEIFRVFANAHPNVEFIVVNANAAVTEMIRRAQAERGRDH